VRELGRLNSTKEGGMRSMLSLMDLVVASSFCLSCVGYELKFVWLCVFEIMSSRWKQETW
jgi:hypothetical protein